MSGRSRIEKAKIRRKRAVGQERENRHGKRLTVEQAFGRMERSLAEQERHLPKPSAETMHTVINN